MNLLKCSESLVVPKSAVQLGRAESGSLGSAVKHCYSNLEHLDQLFPNQLLYFNKLG